MDRADTELGVVVLDRPQELSRHDQRLLDSFCGQAALVLEHLATSSPVTGRSPSAGIEQALAAGVGGAGPDGEGAFNAAICEELHLSIKTVEPAVSAVFTKFDLPGRDSNRRVLAVLAYVDHQLATAVRT